MLSESTVHGHKAVHLENDLLRVTVLPLKGADIYELIHKSTGIDCLGRSPAGLQPPGDGPQSGFLANYEGAWQELFPNAGAECSYRGRTVPFHGEAALAAWDYAPEAGASGETALRLSMTGRAVPLTLERTMRLPEGQPVLILEETVHNPSAERLEFNWGHHLVVGPPLLEEGARLEVPARTILTPSEAFEVQNTTLALGQRSAWPIAAGRRPGDEIDLREIPGAKVHSHDDAFLTDLESGQLRLTNPRLAMALSLSWDPDIFRYMVFWRPFGGPVAPPLTGMYGAGLEPWVSQYPLAEAVEAGEALALDPGESLHTTIRVVFAPSDDPAHPA